MGFQIADDIICVVSEVLKKNKDEIDGAASFKSLGADSLDMFEMILKWEDVFVVEISDDEFEDIKSISDVTKLIENKCLQKKEP